MPIVRSGFFVGGFAGSDAEAKRLDVIGEDVVAPPEAGAGESSGEEARFFLPVGALSGVADAASLVAGAAGSSCVVAGLFLFFFFEAALGDAEATSLEAGGLSAAAGGSSLVALALVEDTVAHCLTSEAEAASSLGTAAPCVAVGPEASSLAAARMAARSAREGVCGAGATARAAWASTRARMVAS